MEDTAMSNLLPPPERCQTMAEVRAAIDTLDHDIITLLSERMRYIEAAARIKTSRDLVRDEDRKAEVLSKVDRAARELGVPAELATALYDQLIEYSISHEFERFDASARSA